MSCSSIQRSQLFFTGLIFVGANFRNVLEIEILGKQ
jgi:hypothetical protein